jgi:MAE_28990/MAE_18760-like HEPN
MNTVKEQLAGRRREFQSYLRLLQHLDKRMLPHAAKTKRVGDLPTAESFKAMKATAFLMVYNIIEATIVGAISELYKIIEQEKCSLSDVSSSLQEVWIDQRFWIAPHKSTPATYRSRAAEMLRDMMAGTTLSLSARSTRLGGNIDGDKVRELCDKHGCKLAIHKRARGGAELETVKKQRNALAHGDKTFVECGQSYGIEDINRISKECFSFLGDFVRSLTKFVETGQYRA